MDKRVNLSVIVLLQLSVILLAIRIIFRIFGASAATPLFTLVYGITTWLLTPFSGIIRNPVFNQTVVFDLVGVIGLVVYGMFLYLFSYITDKAGDTEKRDGNDVIEGEILREPLTPALH
ncbi:hypothetical protein BH11PAT1_BH11PAT1_2370 [soil metagenome]